MIRIGFEILPTHRHGISDSQNKVDSNRYDRPDFIDAYEKRPDQPDGEEEALTSDTGNQEQGSPAETGSIGIDSLLTDEHFYQIQVHNEISCLRECEAEGSDSGESYDSDTQAEAATSAHTESFAKLVDYDEIFASRSGEEVNGPVKQSQSAHADRINSTNLTATLSRGTGESDLLSDISEKYTNDRAETARLTYVDYTEDHDQVSSVTSISGSGEENQKLPSLFNEMNLNHNTSNQEYIIISGSPDRKIPLTYRSPYLHANHIAQAPAYSASNPAEGVIEIILTPEDLGPMKIILTPGEKMHVSVFAEQHETYQILKRNSGILEEELRQSGLGKADVSFSNNGKNSQSGGSVPESTRNTEDEPEASTGKAPPVLSRTGRNVANREIDIRI